MKNRKDFNINVSLGSFYNHSSQSYLINRSTQRLQKANRSSSRSKSKNQNNKENKKLSSRENSKTKLYDQLSISSRRQNGYSKTMTQKQNNVPKNEPEQGLWNSQNKQESKNYADSKIVASTHRKLYTFCNQQRPEANSTLRNNDTHRHTDKIHYNQKPGGSQHKDPFSLSEVSIPESTIMVKEEELKRFTHKFARQKIEYEQLISNLQFEILNLSNSNRDLENQKNQLLISLETKDEELNLLKSLIEELRQKLQQTKNQLTQKTDQVAGLYNMMKEKEDKICSLYSQCQERQKQLDWLGAQQNQLSKLFLPLSNVNHAHSINTSLSSESTPTHEVLEEIEGMRKQKSNIEKEYRNSLTFLEIQNEHIRRQLDIQKQINAELKQEIKQLEQKWKANQGGNDYQATFRIHQKISHFQKEIQRLVDQNAVLAHNKQTLQRSLKVSSQMIVCLKKENTQLKQSFRRGEQETNAMPIEDVRKIILSMMKQQLQLEEKYKRQDEVVKPIVLSPRLQKKYEEGYQSISRKAKGQHCKTQNPDGNSLPSSRKKRTYTERQQVEQFSNDPSYLVHNLEICRR